MSHEWIRPGAFRGLDGVADWRIAGPSISTHFPTASVAASIELASAVRAISPDAEVDLRPGGVTVRLLPDDQHGFNLAQADLARRMSAAAGALGLTADPGAVQQVQVSIDAIDIPAVRAFWRAALGYRDKGEEDLLDPRRAGPPIWFQQMDAPRPQRNRIHLDILVPHDQTKARVAAALAAGGRLLLDNDPITWTLADPEGNEACISSIGVR